jgi:hypothetical protein
LLEVRIVTDEKTLLFVCLHGAAMSRIAAAYFDQTAPAGWHGLSAGVDPAGTLSHTAARLLAGTTAVAYLDLAPPRPISALPRPERVIALRNPEVRYELEGAEIWDLTHAGGDSLRDEIQVRVETLVRTLPAEAAPIR